jgi:hypothetical protein
VDAKRLEEIRARHEAAARDIYETGTLAKHAYMAHSAVGELLAALDEARAQLRVLARYVAHEADATGETLPDLTNGEAREAIDLARKLVEADDHGT